MMLDMDEMDGKDWIGVVVSECIDVYSVNRSE